MNFFSAYISYLTACRELRCETLSRPDLDASLSGRRREARESGATCINYRVAVVDPGVVRRIRGEDKGGSHASPKWHLRIGHVRHLSDGRTAWVRSCEVGDKARGMVIKDYAITKETPNDGSRSAG